MAPPVPPPNAPGAHNNYHSASLYVGDLHLDVTEALLFEIFNAVGPVASIRVCRDAVTRRSLGYAYVNFHNVADAERALDTMNYTMIKSKPCRIMWSQRDPSLRKSGVGNIFVKNLDSSIDNKALYDTFSLFGNILSCKVATDNAGKSKGYGYVHYETGEAAAEAIQKINGMLIAGQEVYVGHFQRRTERPNTTEWTNVYVKNIPESWDDKKLSEVLSAAGTISSAVVMTKGEGDEKKSAGFGFVNFAESDDASKAVEQFNGAKFGEGDDEKELFVSRAQKKSERQRDLNSKYEQAKAERLNKYQGVNLYVKNLDDTVTDDELREHFSQFGTISSARIMKDTAAHSKGFGFVCFSTPEEASKAVTEMNTKLIKGKPVYVALAQRKEVRRAQLEAQHSQQRSGMGGRGMPMGQPPMYGAAPMFYAQPNQMPPQARFVYPQMVPRGPARGPMPQYGRGMPAYQMPQYAVPMQQLRGPGRGARGRNPAAGRGAMQAQNRANFKYTGQARNQPQQAQQAAPQQVPQQQAAPTGGNPQQEPLTAQLLASASPDQQKNMIGERLYPLIHAVQPELAGKITGMLLEMDNGELLHLLEAPDALSSKIQEAINVLEAHTAQTE